MNEGFLGLLGNSGAGMSMAPTADFSSGLLDLGGITSGLTSGFDLGGGLLNSGFMNNMATPQMSFGAPDLGQLGTTNFGNNITNQGGGLMDSLFGKSGLLSQENMANIKPLMSMGSGLYKTLLAKNMINEQIKNSKQAREIAADEQARQKDFINTTRKTFGNSSGATSNYYSA